MALEELPLTTKIIRESNAGINMAVKTANYAGYKEVEVDGVNTEQRIFSIKYMPLNITDRNTVMTFLIDKRASAFFNFTPCDTGITYKVRRIKDSLTEVRNGSVYGISFELKEQF